MGSSLLNWILFIPILQWAQHERRAANLLFGLVGVLHLIPGMELVRWSGAWAPVSVLLSLQSLEVALIVPV